MLTQDEAAGRLGVKPDTLRIWRQRYRQDGRLRGPEWVTVGGRIRYTDGAVAQYLDQQRCTAAR
jgi:transposase-like protein